MRCFLLGLLFLDLQAMDLEKGVIPLHQEDDEEYFCKIAIESFSKSTNVEPSPTIHPYLLRIVSHSRHNGSAERYEQMKREIKQEDEVYLNKLVTSAINLALKDKESQLQDSIPKRKAKFAIAVISCLVSVVSTGVTIAAVFSKHCH